MICPRCKNNVSDGSKFCNQCGWNFNRRWWKEERFTNVKFSQVARWFDINGNNIEVVSARGALCYDISGFIFETYEWKFKYLTIRYYPESDGRTYSLIYNYTAKNITNLFSSIVNIVDTNIERASFGCNKHFDIYKDSHLPGGQYTYCRTAIISR